MRVSHCDLSLLVYCPDMSGLVITSSMLRIGSVEELAAEITLSNGPYVRIASIWSLLGYPSADAARKAVTRQRMPFPVQTLPGRRGRFVRSLDLAKWLSEATVGIVSQCRDNETQNIDTGGAAKTRATP